MEIDMTEETQTPSTEQATSTETTLDSVYKEYGIEEQASNFTETVRPQAKVEETKPDPIIPDPTLDPDGHKQYMLTEHREKSELSKALHEVKGFIGQQNAAAMRAKEEADIKKAVSKVKESGFEAGDDFIEIALGQKARQDPKFMTLYQNRDKNPQAWSKALGAVANEFKGKYAFKTDPQLTENTRAAKTSTQNMATTRTQSSGDDARFEGKTGAAFEREWAAYTNQHY